MRREQPPERRRARRAGGAWGAVGPGGKPLEEGPGGYPVGALGFDVGAEGNGSHEPEAALGAPPAGPQAYYPAAAAGGYLQLPGGGAPHHSGGVGAQHYYHQQQLQQHQQQYQQPHHQPLYHHAAAHPAGPAPSPAQARHLAAGPGLGAAAGVESEVAAVFAGDTALAAWATAEPGAEEVARLRACAVRLRPEAIAGGAGSGGGGASAVGDLWTTPDEALRLLRELEAYPVGMRLLDASGVARAVGACASAGPALPPAVRDAAARVAARWRALAAGALERAVAALDEGGGHGGGGGGEADLMVDLGDWGFSAAGASGSGVGAVL
jgi:hypothetical protein